MDAILDIGVHEVGPWPHGQSVTPARLRLFDKHALDDMAVYQAANLFALFDLDLYFIAEMWPQIEVAMFGQNIDSDLERLAQRFANHYPLQHDLFAAKVDRH